jgi:hypothetical protein
MIMERNKKINRLLEYLNKQEISVSLFKFLMDTFGKEEGFRQEYRLIIDELESHNIIERTSQDKHLITNKGKNIIENSDYDEYLKILKEEFETIEKQRNIEITLAESNLEANRRNNILSKKNTAYTIINIIVGVLNIILLVLQALRFER